MHRIAAVRPGNATTDARAAYVIAHAARTLPHKNAPRMGERLVERSWPPWMSRPWWSQEQLPPRRSGRGWLTACAKYSGNATNSIRGEHPPKAASRSRLAGIAHPSTRKSMCRRLDFLEFAY